MKDRLKYIGADSQIYRENYFSYDFVVENTVLPEDDNDIPDAIVAVGPGRTGSTALIALMISQPGIGRGYYQPWKTMIRHGLDYGQFVIPGKNEGVNVIFAKETLGPFNKIEELDPVELLIKAGYPKKRIRPIILLRDPLATFKSNLRFNGGIQAEMLVSNINFALDLYKRYKDEGLAVIPFPYELAELGHKIMTPLFAKLGMEFSGLEFDTNALKKIEDGGKFVPGESAHPSEWAEIVAPTFSHQRFEYTDGVPVNVSDFPSFSKMPGADISIGELERSALYIEEQCWEKYLEFLTVSAEMLDVGDQLKTLNIWGKVMK